MFKLPVLLLTAALAYSSALSSHRPIKKQAIYPNSVPQGIVPAAQQNVPVADSNAQYQQIQQQIQEPSVRSIQSPQAYSVPQQQLQAQPQLQVPTQQQLQAVPQLQSSAQAAGFPTGQPQPQQYPFVKQLAYYPQQVYPQQSAYPAGTSPQFLLVPNQKYPTYNDGFDQGNGGLYGTGGSLYPPFQWPNYPSFPAQIPQFPGFPSNPGSQPFYPPSNGIGNFPAGGSTSGPDSVVTTASGSDAPEGNSVVLVGNRAKPEKVEIPQPDAPKTAGDASQQQYVFVPQQQQTPGQSNSQTEREISQLNSAAKGAISSYLIYKDSSQRLPPQQFVPQLIPQQVVLPQQVGPQQFSPQQVLLPQQFTPQQFAQQQYAQQQASPNSLLAQQLNAQQLNAQQLNAQQLNSQQLEQQLAVQQLLQQQQQQQQLIQSQQQQQLISQPQLVPQPQLIPQQQPVPQEQAGSPQFINQFVPPQQRPTDFPNNPESASLAYQRFLLQEKQRSEEPSLKSGLKSEGNFPVTESPALTTNSVDLDVTRSPGSA